MKKTPTKTATPAAAPVAAAQPPAPEVEPEVPDWVNMTWPDHIYEMTVYESGDGSSEDISLTRAEYISLKHHLAGMRGYKVGEQTEGRIRS